MQDAAGPPGAEPMAQDQDQRIADVVARERPRLLRFIRRRVSDPGDAEDVLQDVFFALVEANRLLMPIEHVSGWLFRVARNRITDLFRRKMPVQFGGASTVSAEEEGGRLIDALLPSPDAGPDELLAQQMLLEELTDAIDELPRDQREVFVAHELEGRSFKEIAEASGVNVNTLLSRKHYAVRQLRARLQRVYDDLIHG